MARRKEEWLNAFNLALKYFEHYGDINVDINFKTINGVDFDFKGFPLGRWIKVQKESNHSEVENKYLRRIGLCLNNNDLMWEEKYKLCEIYYSYFHKLNFSYNFKTKDGIHYDDEGINLGKWLAKQRKLYFNNKLNSYRMTKLKKLNLECNTFSTLWEKRYSLVEKYFNEYGYVNIPKNFKTTDGYTYDSNGIDIQSWLSSQIWKYNKGSLSKDKSEKLEKLIKNKHYYIEEWLTIYNLVQKYLEYYGHLYIDRDFRTFNGIDYDQNGYNLYHWFKRQKRLFNEGLLPQDLYDKLNLFGNNIRISNYWLARFLKAKEYYLQNGNLYVPHKYHCEIILGDKKLDFSLYSWISNQREAYKNGNLNNEQIQMLESIGMVWNFYKQYKDIKILCEQYNIPYENNKSILNRLSLQEIKCKIEFLKVMQIKLVDKKGILHQIFTMSSENIKREYGYSTEEIVDCMKDYILVSEEIKRIRG